MEVGSSIVTANYSAKFLTTVALERNSSRTYLNRVVDGGPQISNYCRSCMRHLHLRLPRPETSRQWQHVEKGIMKFAKLPIITGLDMYKTYDFVSLQKRFSRHINTAVSPRKLSSELPRKYHRVHCKLQITPRNDSPNTNQAMGRRSLPADADCPCHRQRRKSSCLRRSSFPNRP